MIKSKLLSHYDRPIAFHPVFADITGSITAALMLSQMFYWADRTKDEDGWFYKTIDEWQQETRLTRREQETAKRILLKHKFVEIERRGAYGHLSFRLIEPNLEKALSKVRSRLAENAIRGKRQWRKVPMAESATTFGGKRQTLYRTRARKTTQRLQTTKALSPTPSAARKGGDEAQQVMRACHFSDQRLVPVIAAALALYAEAADPPATLADAARLMIQNHADFIKLGPYLRYRWSERNWIKHGHWVNVDGWPINQDLLARDRNSRMGMQ